MESIAVTQTNNHKNLISEITNSFDRPLIVKRVVEIDLNKMECVVNYRWQSDRDDVYTETFKLINKNK